MTTDTNNDQSPTAALAAPVAQTARIQSIDIMRGVALLGILVMNVQAFVMPFAAYMNPNAYGSLEGRHYWVWYFSHLFFDMKFMSIFSMLFGAGVILLTTRLEQTGRPPARIHYRRTFFLLLIGLVHCYILWTGDILVPYAVCAAVVYLFRRRRPLTLIGIGVVFIAVASGMNALDGINLKNIQNLASTAQTSQVDNADSAAIEQHGDEPIPEDDESVPGTGADSDTSTSDDDGSPVEQSGSPWEMTPEKAVETLAMRQAFWNPTEEQIQEEVTAMRGSWWTDIAYRAPFNAMMHAFFIPFFLIWRAGGLMLIGMGLFKLGCFSARWKTSTYAAMWLVGWGIGLPFVAYGVHHAHATDWDMLAHHMVGVQFNYWASIPVALGWIGMVMFLCRVINPASNWLMQALSAVGQTALSNYLLHTIVFTTIANGRGLGYYGQIERSEQAVLVLCMWIVQLCVSYWWVRHFRFGPAEWLWRSLTYWKRQPMRMMSRQDGPPSSAHE
ncbi:MAG: DUF418 domain-containing protein [Planctomycetes bacterium]|nr:DUF418 domain-containing protein [Planctomycetota bacterium]